MLNNMTKKQIIIIVITIIIIAILFFLYNKMNIEDKEIIIDNVLVENNVEAKTEKNVLIVHITGEVNNPGIVKLEEESRIEDAIIAAGGLTQNADITNVNLAYMLEDGIKIKIPSKLDLEDEDIIIENSGENIIKEESNKYSSKNKTININNANLDDFKTLPGIGESLATRIIKYREENGKFKNIEDIKNVSGIGDNKYEQIKDLISVK